MAFADRLARVNRVFTNRAMLTVSGRVPPLATVVHHGRRSGTEYRTPVLCFDTSSGVAIALTYGPERDWVRNVEAEAGCEMERSGRSARFTGPRITDRAEGEALMPGWIRPVVSRWVEHYMTLQTA
jgi:deazaflavin-dependent oxidoreductase (nitroreductase family)